MKMLLKSAVAVLVAGVGTPLLAQTTINTCPSGFTPVIVNIQASISTASGCPLLENTESRRFVTKFATGVTFAHPAVPGTCISGSITQGTLKLPNLPAFEVRGTTQSAQMIFPEAVALNPSSPLFINGGSFVSGAAMTVVALTRPGYDFRLNLALYDRFTVNYSAPAPIDTEDLLIVGSAGSATAVGRLNATATLGAPGTPILNAPMTVSGTICMKS